MVYNLLFNPSDHTKMKIKPNINNTSKNIFTVPVLH